MTLPNLLMRPGLPKLLMEASQMMRITFVEVLRKRSSVIGMVVMRVYGRMDVFRMVGVEEHLLLVGLALILFLRPMRLW